MPFKKGKSGNPNGRPKGAEGKVTAESRKLFATVMAGEMEFIQNELALLRESSGEKYLKALSGLMPYFMPKQSETEVTFNEPIKPPSWFKDGETA
tara:strand:+ start:64 stop:348 length:285 start_codon:yes stop_codon:yes gene_type:complete